jgi:hypothetical protein
MVKTKFQWLKLGFYGIKIGVNVYGYGFGD